MANTQVKCPYCGKPALFAPENPNRPFCSERCKMIDLGHWADEKYAVPVAPAVDLGEDFDNEDPGTMSNPGEPAPDEDASSPLH